jgi:hypothetical protein
MNKFTQHIPSFMDGFEPRVYEFESTEQLLSYDFFKSIAQRPKFSHFAMHRSHLMEISDEGFHWWVLGRIEHPEEMDLPQWEGWKFRAELDGKDVILSGKEVTCSCGNVLELADGRKAINKR